MFGIFEILIIFWSLPQNVSPPARLIFKIEEKNNHHDEKTCQVPLPKAVTEKSDLEVLGVFRKVQMLAHLNFQSWENRMWRIFFIRPQRPPQNYVVGHIANQDLATRGGSVTRMRAHRERQRRNAPSARKSLKMFASGAYKSKKISLKTYFIFVNFRLRCQI